MSVEQRLRDAGLDLPKPWQLPGDGPGAFEIVRVHAGTVYIAGHGPVDGSEILARGKVGEDLTVEEGYASARLTALAIISSLQRVLGDLDAITWLRATVYVNAAAGLDGPSLTRISDGFSDVVKDVFGERGHHARATVGATSLAFGVPTIIEATVAV